MNKITALFAIMLFALGSPLSLAKTTTKKKAQSAKLLKAWKKRKKAMTPLQLKDLVEENHRLKMRNKKLRETIDLSKKEQEDVIVSLKEEITALKQALQASQATDSKAQIQAKIADNAAADGLSEADEDAAAKRHASGKVIFKVQVGVYNSYEDAEKKKIVLREQGHKTWIVPYLNGKIIPLKQALKAQNA